MAVIIKRGQLPRERVAQHTCGRCGTLAEYTRQDVHGDQREGDYVTCPLCGTFIAARALGWHVPKERG